MAIFMSSMAMAQSEFQTKGFTALWGDYIIVIPPSEYHMNWRVQQTAFGSFDIHPTRTITMETEEDMITIDDYTYRVLSGRGQSRLLGTVTTTTVFVFDNDRGFLGTVPATDRQVRTYIVRD